MFKFADRISVLGSYIYTADISPKSCIYASQICFVSGSCIYALDIVLIASIGPVLDSCIYVLDMSPISDLCNTSIL